MRSVSTGAVLLLLAAPSTAVADSFVDSSIEHIGKHHAHRYDRLHTWATKQFGAKVVGRDVIRFGMPKPGPGNRLVTKAEFAETMQVLNRWKNPPPVVTSSVSTTSSVSSSYASTGGCGGITPYSGGGQCWAIPYDIVACESGGQNVPNSQGSGAQGYYQLMNGGYGSKSQQDQAAAQLWNGGAGRSNWVC